MSLNVTSCYLEARISMSPLCFSETVTTSNTFMSGPGGLSGDGFPMPMGGRISTLSVYDGSTLREVSSLLEFDAGDRISLYATYNAGTTSFTISVVINGVLSPLQITNVSQNANLFATVIVHLGEDL